MLKRRTALLAPLAGALALAGCSGMTSQATVEQLAPDRQSLEIWQRKPPNGPSDVIGQELARGC